MTKRTATINRKTKETQVELTINIDGNGNSSINTGVGFLDHMLDLLTKHGLFDLTIKASGDRIVDDHHTVEDVGICLGQGIKEALGDKKGIRRFSHASVPMQETLANIAVDISGRPALVFNVAFHTAKIGNFRCRTCRRISEGIYCKCRHQPARERPIRHECTSHSRGHI